LTNKQIIKKILLSIAALGLIWLGTNFKSISSKIENLQLSTQSVDTTSLDSYKIIKFSDGDTIDVDMNGKTETIRFLGIDTPETHHPDKGVQCFGPEASKKTEQLLSSGRVKLVSDSKAKNRDKYGRLLRYVYTEDGLSLEETLISEGFAFVFRAENFDQKNKYLKLETGAKDAKTGLWESCNVKKDKNGAYTTG
jgi:micrococcal nuclease